MVRNSPVRGISSGFAASRLGGLIVLGAVFVGAAFVATAAAAPPELPPRLKARIEAAKEAAKKDADKPNGANAAKPNGNRPALANPNGGKLGAGKPGDRKPGTGPFAANKPGDSANRKPTGKGVVRDAKPSGRKLVPQEAAAVAQAVDAVIEAELKEAHVTPAAKADDEDFLRRVTFDLAGAPPSARDVTLFGLDPDPAKRAKAVDRLLESDEFSRNLARYWRDVVYSRATEMRSALSQPSFEDWLHEQLKNKKSWDQIATDMLTASGDVREQGATGLLFAHGAEPAEIAAEASRIFLGIQIQCANCHDHPTDNWKREQFHQLAAFFPRMRLQPRMTTPRTFEIVSLDSTPLGGAGGGDAFARFRENPEFAIRRLDKNNDGKLSKEEANDGILGRLFPRLLDLGDTNKDGLLSADELKKIEPPAMAGRGAREYHMPDLDNPSAPGKKIDPQFFVGNQSPGADLSDADRRGAIARYFTSTDNEWFAKAFVNRVWSEMLGEGFYMPLDDLGPEREARHAKALDLLAEGFAASKYDIRWVYRTIAMTDAYQRQVQARSNAENAAPFVAGTPTRLRSDQIYNALAKALGLDDIGSGTGRRAPGQGGPRAPQGPRQLFAVLFGFDPSTPQDEIVGSVPQALFLMNSPLLASQIRASGRTALAGLLERYPKDNDAINELYLQVLSREPSAKELKICQEYIADVKNRAEAFEDLMWSLLNSSEFLTKR